MEMDYDIVKNPAGGYYLNERLLDNSEIKFLVDAIFSSKSLNGNKAKELANKITSSLSKNDRKDYSYILKSTQVNRTENSDAFYNIEIINEAISQNKRIAFEYLSADSQGKQTKRYGGMKYPCSPYYLVSNFGKYYVLANRDKFNTISPYRLDRITNIEIIDEKRKHPKDIEGFGASFDPAKYINDHIYLFGGEVIHAEINILSYSAIYYVLDWFGNNARIERSEDRTIKAYITCNEHAFYFWAMQYAETMEVVSPQSVVDRMCKTANEIIERSKRAR